MLTLFAFLFLAKSYIPDEFKKDNYHYNLLKTFSDSNTNDIKGYALDKSHVTIVKRKNFNISEDFIFVDDVEQKICCC